MSIERLVFAIAGLFILISVNSKPVTPHLLARTYRICRLKPFSTGLYWLLPFSKILKALGIKHGSAI